MSQDTTNLAWLKQLLDTLTYGRTVEVRGSEIKELENRSLTIDPLWPFITFEDRNYNFDYCKKELLWKINGDPFDGRIKKHAKMWSSVQNDNGSFNSNYGAYWFRNYGIQKAVEQLEYDKYSRRASIPMLASEHVGMDVRDTVCTEAMTFLIRNDRLNCHVHMRSSDQVFGLGTDLPSFSLVQRLVLGLISKKYPEVQMGSLTVVAASSHIYARHFEMADKLATENPAVKPMSNDLWMPIPTFEEAKFLTERSGLGLTRADLGRTKDCSLARWLLSSGEL